MALYICYAFTFTFYRHTPVQTRCSDVHMFARYCATVGRQKRVPPVFGPRGSRLSSLSIIIITDCPVSNRAFPVAAPSFVWNELPCRVTSAPSQLRVFWPSSQDSSFQPLYFCGVCEVTSVIVGRHFNRFRLLTYFPCVPLSNPRSRQVLFFNKNHCDAQLWAQSAHLLPCPGRLSLP